jgi:hypothetical protein
MKLYESFKDRATHLRNLFVDIGNSELSDKMASYTKDQKVFIIKTFSSSGGSWLLWRDNIVESCLLVLQHHRETLSTGLPNSLKKQDVRECKWT